MSRIAAFFGIVVFGGGGAWAFLAPRSFYDVVAAYPPYNQHLVHDLGAFQIGLAAALLGALVVRDALLAALAGVTIGAVVHLVSHVEDASLGGRSSDPLTIAVIAIVLVAGTVLRWRESRHG